MYENMHNRYKVLFLEIIQQYVFKPLLLVSGCLGVVFIILGNVWHKKLPSKIILFVVLNTVQTEIMTTYIDINISFGLQSFG